MASDAIVLSGMSFDELCKLRESLTLGNAVPVVTSASEFFKRKIRKPGSPPSVNIKCQQLYFAAGTY